MANIFTSVGEGLISSYVAADTWYIGWGTGAGTAAKGDTTLFTEASESRVTATDTQPTADSNRFVGTITADGTKTITNVGVFDATTAGNMLLKSDFAGISVESGDNVQFTMTITWS
jgi:hypothetical protein